MVLGVRLKKSLNGGKSFGRRKSGESKSLFTDKKIGRRGGDGDGREYGRKPSYWKERDFDNQERRSPRNFSRRNGDGGVKGNRSNFVAGRRSQTKISRRDGDEDGEKYERKPRYEKPRGYDRDEYDDGARTRGRGERRNRRNENIPVRSEIIDQLRSRGRSLGRKRRDVIVDGYEETTRNSRTTHHDHERRGRRHRTKDSGEENDGSVDSVEASSDKLRLKWKKIDKKRKDNDEDLVAIRSDRRGKDDSRRGKGRGMGRDDAKEEQSVQKNKIEGDVDQVAEQKPVTRLTRILTRTGKKIRVIQKRSDDGSAEEVALVKKKRRIKLDPYDISNKRLDDSPPTAGNADQSEEKDSEISKNAQFRAIQPSPSILSFVEDNLLGRRRLNELKDAGYNIKLSAPLDNVPFSTSTAREQIEENVFKSKLEFFAAAKISSSFPSPEIPEIAFAGRSNVGKSSLLNTLTRQWGVVRTSDKPGLTQTINFFKLAEKLALVDLPGYGFAYAKEEVKEAWEELVKEYVSTRVGLQRVCLLIDTKWGMKPRDHELVDLMERSRTPYQIVLTKTDLVFPIDVARRAMQIQENLKTNRSIVNPVMMVSSKSGAGVRKLRSVLAKITRFVKP